MSYLTELIAKSPGWGLALSDFTLFEALNEIPHEKEKKMYTILGKFPRFEVDLTNLVLASHLGCLYKDYLKEIGSIDKIPENGDKILAATSVRNNFPICTMNMRDYPYPFFEVILKETIKYERKRCPVFITIYVVQPQIKTIVDYYSQRIGVQEMPENTTLLEIAGPKEKK